VQLGRDARRSSTNVRHPATTQVQRRSHSRLTARPAPRPPATCRGGVVDAPSARAASLASSAALPRRPGDPAHPPQLGGGDPYVNGYVNPYVIPYALGVRTPGSGSQGCLSSTEALRGRGAAAPQGALRAIDPSAPRSWRTYGPRRLRRQSKPALVLRRVPAGRSAVKTMV
jgi:hypothetical protein